MNGPRRSARLLALAMLAAGLVFVAAPADAATTPVVIGGVTYTYDENIPTAGAVVTSYTADVGQTTVAIAAAVTVPGVGEVPVKSISNNVFQSKSLTAVALNGNNLTAIGDHAFAGNTLTTVTIPDSVTTIGTTAFFANALTAVTLGNHVTTIGESAFGNNQLTAATIPASVTAIGGWAFYNNSLATVTILDSVTAIGEGAFFKNGLTTADLGNRVTTIGSDAFGFNALTAVTIPASVTTIGDFAFDSNSALRSVRFAGPPPAVTPAGGTESFDTYSGALVLHHPASQTGYTSPTWNGYATMAGLSPTISGTTREGKTLTAQSGLGTVPAGADPTTVSYQWLANGTALPGATTSTLQLGKVHAGRRISVRVTSASPGPDTETRTTASTPIVSSAHKRIVLSSKNIKKGSTFKVAATGLRPGQKLQIILDGRVRFKGKADSTGTIYRAVRFSSKTKTGKRLVKVYGLKSKGKPKYVAKAYVRYYK